MTQKPRSAADQPPPHIASKDVYADTKKTPAENWELFTKEMFKILENTTHSERSSDYGPPIEHHTLTAKLWSAWLGVEILPEQVSVLFILDKLSRLHHAEKQDTILDIAGYAKVHADVVAARLRQQKD